MGDIIIIKQYSDIPHIKKRLHLFKQPFLRYPAAFSENSFIVQMFIAG